MDIKRRVKGGQGNSAVESSDIISRACSWAYGADASVEDIDFENMEEDQEFGVENMRPTRNRTSTGTE